MGLPLTSEEFTAFAPEKLELADGRIPGGEKLVILLQALACMFESIGS